MLGDKIQLAPTTVLLMELIRLMILPDQITRPLIQIHEAIFRIKEKVLTSFQELLPHRHYGMLIHLKTFLKLQKLQLRSFEQKQKYAIT